MNVIPGFARPDPTLRTSYILGTARVRAIDRPRRMMSAVNAQASSMKRRLDTFNRTVIRVMKKSVATANRAHVAACRTRSAKDYYPQWQYDEARLEVLTIRAAFDT